MSKLDWLHKELGSTGSGVMLKRTLRVLKSTAKRDGKSYWVIKKIIEAARVTLELAQADLHSYHSMRLKLDHSLNLLGIP
jgi:hypothetical protein